MTIFGKLLRGAANLAGTILGTKQQTLAGGFLQQGGISIGGSVSGGTSGGSSGSGSSGSSSTGKEWYKQPWFIISAIAAGLLLLGTIVVSVVSSRKK